MYGNTWKQLKFVKLISNSHENLHINTKKQKKKKKKEGNVLFQLKTKFVVNFDVLQKKFAHVAFFLV